MQKIYPMNLMSFSDALNKAGQQKKHLLLGNGFSIAWKPDVFLYNSLYEEADFSTLSPYVQLVFEKLQTRDFELVMRDLIAAANILKVYDPANTTLIKQLEIDADALKNLLVTTIANSHPENPNEITESEYLQCATFLSKFDSIYTLNYDLLLYWVIMHYNATGKIVYDDGFRTPDDGIAQYVTWEVENTVKQNIFYLHGALHLFDAGAELQKYTWVNTGIRLIEQIRNALDNNYFPLFVSEGTSTEKKQKIIHSNYLSRGLRSFASIGGVLFTYGHSLADNDTHILKLISKGKITTLFVGIYGDVNSKENKMAIANAIRIAEKRANYKKPLSVEYYQLETANVWRV